MSTFPLQKEKEKKEEKEEKQEREKGKETAWTKILVLHQEQE